MNVVYLVSVSDRINLFKVCTYLHLNCDDWFTQWQKEACQQHGKSLPISSWDAAEEVVASAIYGGGYYVSLKFSIMSNVSLPSNISAVCNTWNWRSSVGSKGCSALSRSKESFTRALLSKIISRNPSSKSPSIWKVYWLMLSWPKCAARFLISTTSGLCLAQRRGDFILVSLFWRSSISLPQKVLKLTRLPNPTMVWTNESPCDLSYAITQLKLFLQFHPW